MAEPIKKYIVNADESEIFAVSVVDSPAVESDFIYMAKEDEKPQYIALESNEKHLLYGCALRPDFPIYRYDEEDGEYYIEFTKDAVEKLCRKYFQHSRQNSWTKQHKTEANGITVVESWLKSDMQYDKSLALGLDKDLPLGTWFIGAYVDSNEVWEEVKKGTYKGFSIEAMCALESVNFNKQDNMNGSEENEMFDKAKAFIKDLFKKKSEEELEEATPAPEPVAAPAPEPAPEPVVEPQPEPVQEPSPAPEPEPQPEPAPEPEEPKENPLNEVIQNLTEEIKALKGQIDSLKADNDKLAHQPSVEPTNTKGGQKADTYAAWREQMKKFM